VAPDPTFVRLIDGNYTPLVKSAPAYVFSSNSYLNPPLHFFISVSLSFPNRKPIHTFALVDCGATTSCVSDRFVTRHSLPRRVKETPIPIMAVDDRPIASGLITHDVITHISVADHKEVRPLAVVSVAYPIILGLDWLRQHNPDIDLEASTLSLDCCGLTRQNPVTVTAKGFGPKLSLPSSKLNSSSTVGIGFGHSDAISHSARMLSPVTVPSVASLTPEPAPAAGPDPTHSKPSLLASFMSWGGYGRPNPLTSPSTTHASSNIRFVSAKKFAKAARSSPDDVCLLRYHSPSSPIYIRSTTSSSIDSVDDEIPALPHVDDVPPKYMDYMSTVFSPAEFEKLPPHRPYDVDIELEEGKTPPFGPLYRLTPPEREALTEYVNKNLKRGHVRSSTSSAGAPVLFIRKKTGELRLCVDYRGLNAITKKNRYPVPLVHDILDRVQGCKIFSVIDLKSAYSHLRIKEGDEWKTAFRTPLGLFEHLVVPYGLTNAPAAFQTFIQDTLRDLLDIICVVYLDDILIFSRTQEDHDKHVKLVLDRLRDANLCANPAKCEWDKSEFEYLGYVIGTDGIKMNPKKLDTIVSWPEPSSVKEVQSFLGLANFYRRFINGYSRIARPLTDLTRKDVRFGFSDAARTAFNSLKREFTSFPTLRHFDPLKPCTVSTDASDFAISGVFQQPDDDGTLHPVAFYPRKMSPAEINYEIHDKELLDVIDTFRDMRAWLLGSPHPISVISDHRNLTYFMSSQVLNRRQARWAMFLSDFDFRLVWAPGKENVADAPSRRTDFSPKKGDDTLLNQNRIMLTPKHTDSLTPHKNTQHPSNIINAMTTLSIDTSTLFDRFKNALQKDSEWREALIRGNSDFTSEGGLVFHKGKLFVPLPLRADILHSRHDAVIAGHPGRNRTFGLVARDYSWPGMQTFVRRYVEACDTCARIKTLVISLTACSNLSTSPPVHGKQYPWTSL
jgi:Reverse transcriptase (RNA-dependent DNA polymerase)/RNase H-like domain found in reverse transcriptase/Integrase zinc binding domain/Retroviral aspartyl protease